MIHYRDFSVAEAAARAAPHVRTLAADVVTKAAAELGIAPPAVVWFVEADPADRGTYSRAYKIVGEAVGITRRVRLHAGLTGEELVRTIAHELQHVADYDADRVSVIDKYNSDDTIAIAEARARAFEESFTAKWFGRQPSPEALSEAPDELLKDLRRAIQTLP